MTETHAVALRKTLLAFLCLAAGGCATMAKIMPAPPTRATGEIITVSIEFILC